MSGISVIIPHYDNGEVLYRAYSSVMKQKLLPSEIIIVDDGSVDISFLKKLERDHFNEDVVLNIIYLEKNYGPSFARNVAINKSVCDYIAFLDCDDVWHEDKLFIQYNLMLKNNLDFTFHRYLAFPTTPFKESKIVLKKINITKLAFKQIICTPAVMVKRDVLVNFNESIRYCEDFLCWVMSNNCNYFYFIDLPLANGFKNQYGESGLSSNMKKMHDGFLKVCKILYKNGYFNTFQYLIFLILEYIKFPLRVFKSFCLQRK